MDTHEQRIAALEQRVKELEEGADWARGVIEHQAKLLDVADKNFAVLADQGRALTAALCDLNDRFERAVTNIGRRLDIAEETLKCMRAGVISVGGGGLHPLPVVRLGQNPASFYDPGKASYAGGTFVTAAPFDPATELELGPAAGSL